MGAGAVLSVFLMTGASIGIVGTFVGTTAGMLFCWNIDAVKRAIERLSGAELFAAEIYFFQIYQQRLTSRSFDGCPNGVGIVISRQSVPGLACITDSPARRCVMNDTKTARKRAFVGITWLVKGIHKVH